MKAVTGALILLAFAAVAAAEPIEHQVTVRGEATVRVPPDFVVIDLTIIAEGADIVDIGGESTRPGAAQVSAADEIARVVPTIAQIRAAHPDAPISVDTMKSEVAIAAIDAGATYVNDVSAFSVFACAFSTAGVSNTGSNDTEMRLSLPRKAGSSASDR